MTFEHYFLGEWTYPPGACKYLISLFDRAADEVEVVLAATDAAKAFCQKTYTLVWDGMLVTELYSHLQALATAAADGYYPNVILENAAHRQELLAHATQYI